MEVFVRVLAERIRNRYSHLSVHTIRSDVGWNQEIPVRGKWMEKLLLRPSEVAELLGIGRSKSYELIGSGLIPSIRIGTSVRVPLDSLRAWIEAQNDAVANQQLHKRLDDFKR